jgi:hypothetical protein
MPQPFRSLFLFTLVLFVLPLTRASIAADAAQAPAAKDTVLKAADISPKIFPEHVFYRGRVAPVQMRNTGGVHFADDFYVLAGLVDVSGYSSGVREKYQGYLLTEVPLDINGQALHAGAYGIGFLQGAKFIVTDLGSNNVLEVSGNRDAELKMPMPLQVLAAKDTGTYRLYVGRDFVSFKRTK